MNIYLGGFPPPYGGVTIKNSLIYSRLLECVNISHSRFYTERRTVNKILVLIKELLARKTVFVIGLSNESLIKFTRVFKLFNRNAMKQSIVIVMGGTLHKIINEDKRLAEYFSLYKTIYVEADSMKDSLNIIGLKNIKVLPNCRNQTSSEVKIKSPNLNKLKCVYFSLISKEKGADIIFESVKELKKKNIQFEIDFYGTIEKSYQEEFEQQINLFENVNYCGIFKADKEDVYTKLNEYDLLLFPTRWKNEGIPGILVESKFAALPAIVSDVNYNSEIVNHNVDGIVLKHNNHKELADAIENLYNDREDLMELKKNAYKSRSNYLIDNYIVEVINELGFEDYKNENDELRE